MLFMPERFTGWPQADAVRLVQQLRFGLLVSIFENELQFSHLPLLVDVEDGRIVRLRGHFARQNPHWRALAADPRATVVFNGPNAYLSAQWFTPECEAAPSWNYVVVHVNGRVRLLDTPEQTSAIVDELVEVNEAELPERWPLEDYSPERRARLLPHILGFALDVDDVLPKFKLNQHYADADKLGAARGLESRGTDAARAIAAYMRASIGKADAQGADVTRHLER
ncbi:FMN-binding negative transcriptional regulator [Verticiella sediminum]|uniref:FMN-binding negative transcriptional regulator n=1 Tax=Verticiella sediminum TaxID=1247510 RepID=A0A556AZH4_9BURK|nr:FMN-binding negative transcriptional regulator [Verticiella sediminum]TSH98316.1 FMN-binding negative transcriptional regulator [Verticiella sediminum]